MTLEEWGEEYIWAFNEEKNKPEIMEVEYVWIFNKEKNGPELRAQIKKEDLRIKMDLNILRFKSELGSPIDIIRKIFKNSATYRKVNEKETGSAKRRKRRKRDSYEHIYLLSIPSNCARHHITDKYVIPIPKDVHNTKPILQTIPHRKLIEEWMKENNRVLYNITQFIKETES